MMNLEQCPERQKLAQTLAAAIQKTYIARQELRAAKNDRIVDTAPFTAALEQARLKQSEVEKVHDKHVEEHGCGLNSVSFARPGS